MIQGQVHPAFAEAATTFGRMFSGPQDGGGGFAVHLDGIPVVDIWAGYADSVGQRPWLEDTVSMSFSTTKGVAATLAHRVLQAQDIEYDTPVVEVWPSFGQAGKQTITIRELLSHGAGMHRLRPFMTRGTDLFDHPAMYELLASHPHSEEHRGRGGYHALTYGWLVAGLVESITGRDVRDVLRTEVAEPLGVANGMWFGAPPDVRSRLAPLFPKMDLKDRTVEGVARTLGRLGATRPFTEASMVRGFAGRIFDDESGGVHDTAMPAVNGVFTARALSTMYSALACGGETESGSLLTRERLEMAGRVQYRNRDYVLGAPMRWRIGYHQVFTGLRLRARRAFGHFGAGGSGGWADPERRVSMAFVTNRMGSATTPMGDVRILRLGAAVLDAADAVRQPLTNA